MAAVHRRLLPDRVEVAGLIDRQRREVAAGALAGAEVRDREVDAVEAARIADVRDRRSERDREAAGDQDLAEAAVVVDDVDVTYRGVASVVGLPFTIWPVLVATGLTSSLPMIPSSQEPGCVIRFGRPEMQTRRRARDAGGRRAVHDEDVVDLGRAALHGAAADLVVGQVERTPAVGSPSMAYHWRSTPPSGTAAGLQGRKVRP